MVTAILIATLSTIRLSKIKEAVKSFTNQFDLQDFPNLKKN